MYHRFFSISLLAATTLGLAALVPAAFAFADTSIMTPVSYYPQLQPSSYYLLPGQMLNVNGSGFLPGETVTITMGGQAVGTAIANGGNVNNVSYLVPYADSNLSVILMATGNSSMTSVSQVVSVGTFYPQVNPSSYYLAGGERFTLNMSGFAPMEPITIAVGSTTTTGTADTSGNLNTDVVAPMIDGTFTVVATGTLSNTSSQRTITAYVR